jgi:hypothetical protein
VEAVKRFLAYVGVMTLVSVAVMPYTGVGITQAVIVGASIGVVVHFLDRATGR